MYADVLVNIKSLGEKIFTYSIPKSIKNVSIGMRVSVPLSNRKIEGLILNIKDKCEFDTKDIIEVLDEMPVLNHELLELGKYMKNIYLCSLMSAYESMLPNALKFNKNNIKIKYDTYIIKIGDIDKPTIYEKNILDLFIKNDKVLKSSIKNKSTLKRMLDKQILKEVKQEKNRLLVNTNKTTLKVLTDKQKEVYNNILNTDKMITLLRGVTGSGKTEIYMHLIMNTIKNKRNAIVLVPEITLTTQLINRFRSVFNDKIAVFHSGLSDGEKYDEYRRIRNKEVNVVIGTRSAIFTPLTNIGLIIIDEEHVDSYKQENEPRYRAVDIALKRGEYNNSKVVLGSATPLIESYTKAKMGKYNLVELTDRVNDIPMPTVYVVDMKNEIKKGNSILSKVAMDLITDRLNKNEQIMILINRRGYSNYILCKECGNVIKCPNCDISLTYHKNSDTLRCHYCGFATNRYSKCPNCNSNNLIAKGIGTEKIEEYLKDKFEGVKVIRMDRDTTSNKGMHERIVTDFNNKKYDILLGTQMISKGLDFENVTLVIVLNGDSSLNIPDYRSAEKTFDLLTQVSGRSGRGNKEGISLIQTYNPNHYSIILSKKHDYIRFYNEEIKIRRKLNYPPFCLIVSIRISTSDYELGNNEIEKINKYLKEKLNESYTILGPTVSFKINNIYTFKILIKYKEKQLIYKVLEEIKKHNKNKNIKLEIDFNPIRV